MYLRYGKYIPSSHTIHTFIHGYFLWLLCFVQSVLQVCNPLYLVKQGYDNSESSVRKACVFCLVAIYAVIGEDLKPHLSQLSSSKVTWPISIWNVDLDVDLAQASWLKNVSFLIHVLKHHVLASWQVEMWHLGICLCFEHIKKWEQTPFVF